MSPVANSPRGMYFEDFTVGQRIVSPGRTVTESDVVSFAGLSGDYNQIHVDVEYAKASQFGQRISHGLLGLAIASGLAVQTGIMEGTIIAFREIREWKFIKPVFIGDTIHVEIEVLELKDMRRIGVGGVVISMEIVNQNEEKVMKGIWNTLFALRPTA